MPGELILVVEDIDLLRDGMQEMLAQEGFHTITATDGQAALEQMKSLTPDLIISDITMPVMDGFQFFNTVRSNPNWVGIPFIFLSARSEPADLLAGRNLGVEDYLTKPIHRDELVTTIRSRLSRFHQSQMSRVQQAYTDSLIALANAIETRTPGVQMHIERVMELSLVLARKMGWADQNLDLLKFSAILHDIGKIHISAVTLFKTEKLTSEEWEIIRRHPITGAEMIKDVPFLGACTVFVRHHHERWDGQGYPDRLAGEAIPEGARILSVADAFDAMCSDRPYRAAITPEQALNEVVQRSGIDYDPQVVEALQKAWSAGEVHMIFLKAA